MITELKPTNLIAVEVPVLSYNHKAYASYPNLNLLFDLPDDGGFNICGTLSVIYDFTKDNYLRKFKILGEVTKDKIGFDVEPYVKFNSGNLLWESYNNNPPIYIKEKSFYSLLAANGLYFENPLNWEKKAYLFKGSENSWGHDDLARWQSFEDKLIKGKLLILEKL